MGILLLGRKQSVATELGGGAASVSKCFRFLVDMLAVICSIVFS